MSNDATGDPTVDDNNIVRLPRIDATATAGATEARDERQAAIDAFAGDLRRAFDAGADHPWPRDTWIAVLVAAQNLCAQLDVDDGRDAFAAMALAMRELDHGRVPAPLKPSAVDEMPSAWRHWLGA